MAARGVRGRALALACAASFVACGDGSAPKSAVRQSVESLERDVFVPLTVDFAGDAQALAASLDALCVERDSKALESARERWDAAAARWKQTEVIAFGPHTLSPWRLAAKIDFWPARETSIEQQLTAHGAGAEPTVAADDAGTAVPAGGAGRAGGAASGDAGSADGSELGAAARGLPVIEYLLFAGGGDEVRSAYADDAAAAARCAYLHELGRALLGDARALRDAWRGSFGRDLILADGPNEHFETIRDGFGQVTNGLAFVVAGIREDKLGKPLGGSRATAHPESVESRFAQRSIADALDALRGVENVFTGRYRAQQALGVGALLRLRGHEMDRTFARKLSDARDALEAIDGQLDRAVIEDRAGVQNALAALDELLVFLQVDVTQALAVTVTFGAGDGD
jgi:predicted lipoprotein